MQEPYYKGQTLDDVLRLVVEGIQAYGDQISPTKGACKELTGVLIELTNPRARLSRTETRGKPFSCLGELCWYLAKDNDLNFISYYIPNYRKFADDNIIYGGYGPRLFNWNGINQVENIIGILKKKPDSRKAVIQIFEAEDITQEHNDTPCTCTMQFMIRQDKLHMFTSMRSNDVVIGLPHDIFCFTMLQEIIARTLDVELGIYKHFVGSLHIYDDDKDAAQQFLNEGWQSTDLPMPAMPVGNPWPNIKVLLQAESALREKSSEGTEGTIGLDPYWADLIRLLRVIRCSKDDDIDQIREISKMMSSNVYYPFIRAKAKI